MSVCLHSRLLIAIDVEIPVRLPGDQNMLSIARLDGKHVDIYHTLFEFELPKLGGCVRDFSETKTITITITKTVNKTKTKTKFIPLFFRN